MCICVCWRYILLLFSCSVMSDSFVTPWTVARQAPLSMGFPGKNTGMGCHFLLHLMSISHTKHESDSVIPLLKIFSGFLLVN